MPTPLTEGELQEAMADLPGWSAGGGRLSRTYTAPTFRDALAFIVRVGFEAEAMNHHPEIYNVYNRIRLDLCTHDAGDRITAKDIQLAHAADAVAERFCMAR